MPPFARAVRGALQFLTLFSLALSGVAAERATNPIESDYGKQPNHLEPISPELEPSLGAYNQLLQKRLLPKMGDFGTFVFLPSFSGEMAVAIYGTDYTKSIPEEPRSFRIAVMRANKSLWNSMQDSKKRNQPVRVTRTEIAIDRELAVAIQRAWASMLLRTRYPSKAYRGLDGFTARFSVFVSGLGQLYGETWSPRHGLPKEFVELGFAVVQYASANPEHRAKIRDKLVYRLQRFEHRVRNA